MPTQRKIGSSILIILLTITVTTFAQNPSTLQQDSPLLYPSPKVLKKLPADVTLSVPLNILVSKNEEPLIGLKVLSTEMYERFEAANNVQIVDNFDPAAENVIMLILNQNAQHDKLLKKMDITLPDKDTDGVFALSTQANRIVITAKDPAGLLYGVYDLLQLARLDSNTIKVPGVEIQDWPTLKMRGYMFETSQSLGVQKIDYYYKLLDRLAQARINTVFPNVSDGTWFCMQMPSRPELSQPRSFRGQAVTNFHPFSEQQLRDLIAYGNQRGIEFIPMIQSIGHARFYTDVYPELADPCSVQGVESSLDPFNPGTERLLDDIYGFCAKIYSSPYMHVAGDEVYNLGNSQGARHAYQAAGEAAKDFTIYEWAYKHQIETITRLLKKYGKKQIIKTDVFLKHPRIVNIITKDLLLDMNNHYSPQINIRDPRFFVGKGFKMIGCPAIVASGALVMPSTANIANVTQWTKIIQDLSLVGSRLCLWNPERILDDACWSSITYSGSLFWEGTPESKKGGTFDHNRFFDAYTKFNFGLDPTTGVPQALQTVQNNAPSRKAMIRLLLINNPDDFHKAVRDQFTDKQIKNYAEKVNDPTGRTTIKSRNSVIGYINKLNTEVPPAVQTLQKYRKMVKNNLQEYDGLLLVARIEQFLGKVGKLHIEKKNWPLDEQTKKAVREIAAETDQLLADILKARDHWRYEDNPARAGKRQGWERRDQNRSEWLLRYFFEFKKMLTQIAYIQQ